MQFNIADDNARVPVFTFPKATPLVFTCELQAGLLYLLRSTDDGSTGDGSTGDGSSDDPAGSSDDEGGGNFYDFAVAGAQKLFPGVRSDHLEAQDHLVPALLAMHTEIARDTKVYELLEDMAAMDEVKDPTAFLIDIHIGAGSTVDDMRLTRIEGLYVYMFCGQICSQSFEACEFGRVKYFTQDRQLRFQSGGATERTLFLCTMADGMYVGTFLDFIPFRFPSSINVKGEAFVEQRMLAHVSWFPKVETIKVTDRRITSTGRIMYVPLDQQSTDPEIIIDLKSDLHLLAATLLRVDESPTRRSRFLYVGQHSHKASDDPPYIQNGTHNTHNHGLVHSRR